MAGTCTLNNSPFCVSVVFCFLVRFCFPFLTPLTSYPLTTIIREIYSATFSTDFADTDLGMGSIPVSLTYQN